MSAIVSADIAPRLRLDRMLAVLRAGEPSFLALGLLLFAAMLPTGFAALVDPRLHLGVNVWEKSLKFEFALAVYLLTLVFFARYLPTGLLEKRWYRVYSGAVVGAIVLEMIWIGGSSALGVASHFSSTPVGMVVYPLMGAAAVLLTSASAVYAVQIARNRETGLSPVMREAVVVGLALVLPLTLVTAGTMSSMGAHWIGGAPTDAGGLALMGWARDGGDLRVAHFFATHALHFIPAAGLLSLMVFGPSNRLPLRVAMAAFVVLVGYAFVQALQGQPFLPWLGAVA